MGTALVPYQPLTYLETLELGVKMDRIKAQSLAVLRAKERMEREKSIEAARDYINTKRDRDALIRTLPPLRIVI